MDLMKRDIIPVSIRHLLPSPKSKENIMGWSIFLGDDQKVFIIQVESSMGHAIHHLLTKSESARPMTHDLINSLFAGFGITVERVVITELRDSTFYARMILQQQNELGRKIVEVDARPSDCIAIATAQNSPIYVDSDLFENLEDMTRLLETLIQDSSADPGEDPRG